MITPSFGLSATERVLPKLALDFTTGTLDPRVTFTRALNTATRVNSSGYVEVVNADLPRFDYDPVTLESKGLLIEESRVNLIKYSNDLNNNTVWSKLKSSIGPDAAVSPSNVNDADKLIEDTQSGVHVAIQTVTTVIGTVYAGSIYLKAAERTRARLQITNSAGTVNFEANVNLTNGIFTTSGGGSPTSTSASVVNAGNGWYRVAVTMAAPTTSTQLILYIANDAGVFSYTGNGTSGIYAWGAQLEAGAFATSYIPTTTTALTRNADVATMTGTNFSDWFNASEGTFVARSASLTTAAATRSIFDVRSATTIRMSLQNYGTYGSFVAVDTTTQASLDGTSSVAANTFFQIAGGYKINDFGCAANGGAIVTDISGTVPVANVAWIGGVNGTSVRNGWISNIWYYPQKLTSAEISAFSKQG